MKIFLLLFSLIIKQIFSLYQNSETCTKQTYPDHLLTKTVNNFVHNLVQFSFLLHASKTVYVHLVVVVLVVVLYKWNHTMFLT